MTTRSDHVPWLDVAKGVAISLVVLHHARLELSRVVPGTELWNLVCLVLVPVRMPLFFLVSGMLAARALTWSWPEVWRRRLRDWVWLYLLWSALVTTLVLTVGYESAVGTPIRAGYWLQALHAPWIGTWYLLALPLFLVLCRLAGRRGLPVLGALSVLLCTAVAARWIEPAVFSQDSIARFACCFITGMALRAPLLARTRDVPPARAARLAVVLLLAALPLVSSPLWTCLTLEEAAKIPGVFPLTVALLTPAAVLLCVALAGTSAHVPVARLGRRTLGVYVLHLPLLNLLSGVLERLDAALPAAAGLVLVPVVTVLALATTLALEHALRDVAWLWAAPGHRRERPRGTPAPGPRPAAPA